MKNVKDCDSSKQILETLAQLDLSRIDDELRNTAGTIDSYQTMYSIAKSITSLNINRNFETTKVKM